METLQTHHDLGTVLAVRECRETTISVNYTLFEFLHTDNDTALYSIAVTTRSENGEETVSAYDISRNRETAVRLFHLLADHLVTSCTLYEVLEDLL